MSSFVYDGTTIPDSKLQFAPLSVAAAMGLTASEWNLTAQAIKDLRTALLGISSTQGVIAASNLAGSNTGDLTLAAVGSSPNASAASLAGQVLILQPADGTHPGLVTTGAQTFAGVKTFSSTPVIPNLSGTNTGDVTLGAVGSSPSANGASLAGQVLTLQPVDATHPGVLTTGAQTIAGDKTFNGSIITPTLVNTPSVYGTATSGNPGLFLRSFLTGGNTGSDFSFGTANVRTAGNLIVINNQFSPVATLDYQANLVLSGNVSFLSQLISSAGNCITFIDSRAAANASSSFQFHTLNTRTAGYLLEVQNQNTSVLHVDYLGNLLLESTGGSNGGSFVDNTGSSGHTCLTCSEGLYVVIGGKLNNVLTDGLYTYAGHHGGVTIAGAHAQPGGGWLFEVKNGLSGVGAATDSRFFIDYNGGIGQGHGLSLAQFGATPEANQATSLGQFLYGQAESVLMYAFDKHRWYYSDGTAWNLFAVPGDATAYDATDGSGTTGSQTINKLKGKGKFAAGASNLTITNSKVTGASHVTVVLQTNDTTAQLKNVVPTAGAFDVNIVACTAATVFSFVVEN